MLYIVSTPFDGQVVATVTRFNGKSLDESYVDFTNESLSSFLAREDVKCKNPRLLSKYEAELELENYREEVSWKPVEVKKKDLSNDELLVIGDKLRFKFEEYNFKAWVANESTSCTTYPCILSKGSKFYRLQVHGNRQAVVEKLRSIVKNLK